MEKTYKPIHWEDEPSKETPINAENLNKMDSAIDVIDTRVVEADAKMAEMDANIQMLDFEGSSAISVIKKNVVTELASDVENFTHTFEKPFTGRIIIDCDTLHTYALFLTTAEGTEELFCTGAYSSEVENVLGFRIESTLALESIRIEDHKNAVCKFDLHNRSITEEKLSTDYLAQIKTQAQSAEQSANMAVEKAEMAKTYAGNAQAVSGVGIATKEIAGLVKGGDMPIDESGVLQFLRTTTDRTLTESHAGGVKINSMDGESQQATYSGKNLLENTATSKTVGGITFTVNKDKSITVKGTATGAVYFAVGKMKPIANQSYIFNHTVSWDGDAQCYLDGIDGSSAWITPRTFTPTTDTEFSCKIYIAGGKTLDLTFYPMIRLASVTDATYEPYVGGTASPNPDYPQEIKSVEVSEIKSVGKNLFNANNAKGAAYLTTGYLASSDWKTFVLKVEPNSKIALSGFPTEGGAFSAYLNSGDVKDFKRTAWVTPSNNGIHTIPSDVEWIGICYKNNNNYPNKQIEKSTTVTEYEPYTEKSIQLSAPIILRGIGDVKDVLCKCDGVYGVAREYSPFTLDGTQNVSKVSPTDGTKPYFRTDVISDIYSPASKSTVADMLCNAFISSKWTDIYYGRVNGIGIDSKTIGWCDDKFKNYTVDEMKAWLVENPINGIYRLATPTFEPLPLADQVTLHKLQSFDTVTYISTNSEIEPIMEVEYGTSKVGAYALKGMNTADANALMINQLNTLTNELATQLVAGSEG